MQKQLSLAAILIVILYGIYNAKFHKKSKQNVEKSTVYTQHLQKHRVDHLDEELRRIHTAEYTKHYILDIINHGSEDLKFKTDEIMEGGFASKEDAEKIACYLLALRGESCGKPYPKDAPMYYSSNCAGCHGEDAKGLNGTYPDLTRKPLLGIEKRETFLLKLKKAAPLKE